MSGAVLVWRRLNDCCWETGNGDLSSPFATVDGASLEWGAEVSFDESVVDNCTSIEDGKAQAAAWLAARGVEVRDE